MATVNVQVVDPNLDDEDAAKPWEQLPGESGVWFRRFLKYLQMPEPRTMVAVYREEMAQRKKKRFDKTGNRGEKRGDILLKSRVPGDWTTAKRKYEWKLRAKAFDDSVYLEALRQRKQSMQAEILKELDDAERMRIKGRELMDMPVYADEKESTAEHEGPDGITIHKTVLCLPGDPKHYASGVASLREARVSARLALGMPLVITKQSLADLDDTEITELYDRLVESERRKVLRRKQLGSYSQQLEAEGNTTRERSAEEDPDLNP